MTAETRPPRFLAAWDAEAAAFRLLARGPEEWQVAPAGAGQGATSLARLPDRVLRLAPRAEVAVVAGTAVPAAWVLPPSVRASGRLEAKLWRPDPQRFALGVRVSDQMRWLVRPPAVQAEGGRVALRAGASGSWLDHVRVGDGPRVRGQLEDYQALMQALFDGSAGLAGTLQARVRCGGRRIEITLGFDGGNVRMIGLDGASPDTHPEGATANLALQVTPLDAPPPFDEGAAPAGAWVFAWVEAAGAAARWRFHTDLDRLAEHVRQEGTPL